MDLKNQSAAQGKLKQMEREAEERDAQRRAKKSGHPYLDVKKTPISIEALALVPEEEAKNAKMAVLAIRHQKQEAVVVAFDPQSKTFLKAIEKLQAKNYKLDIRVASLSSLSHIWGFYKFVSKEAEHITGSIEIAQKKLLELQKKLTSLEDVKNVLKEASAGAAFTSDLLEIILAGALANRASDIHLEPEEEFIKLRFRIDGLLHDVFSELKKNIYLYILSRVKLLSELKLNVHDEAQDGRFAIKFPQKEIEVRVAVAPAEFGEVAVMRLLDPDVISLSLSDLGLREDDSVIVENELKKPNGMILNTGPTGSGKTTTLYAFLKHKQTPEVKIITIEDPIEYQLPGIEQTQVDEESGYTFQNGLRSLMRQDPDIILVGEIRDKETAEISIQAALTGHLVFSTVHANEAAGAIPRLLDLGVRSSSIGPALNLIIAQRLVRRLCGKCKTESKLSDDLARKIKKFVDNLPSRVSRDKFKKPSIYEPRGCSECNGVGFKGRVGIYELLLIGPEMEELIDKETNEASLQEYALKREMVTVQADGILKAINGITTFEEIESATGPLIWE